MNKKIINELKEAYIQKAKQDKQLNKDWEYLF